MRITTVYVSAVVVVFFFALPRASFLDFVSARKLALSNTKHQITDTKYQIPDTKNTTYKIPSAKYQIPRTRCQVPH